MFLMFLGLECFGDCGPRKFLITNFKDDLMCESINGFNQLSKNYAKTINSSILEMMPPTPTWFSKRIFFDENHLIWSNGWIKNFDFSGVAWDDKRAGTLITPQHIVFSAHFRRDKIGRITFLSKENKFIHRKIVEISAMPNSDVGLGKLNEPVPDSVCFYNVLDSRYDWHKALRGSWCFLTTSDAEFYLKPIAAITKSKNIGLPEEIFFYQYKEFDAPPFEFYGILKNGDSGHPSFLWHPGFKKLILMGTHHHRNYGPFYGGPDIQKWIKNKILDWN